jgi:hypothetical protein
VQSNAAAGPTIGESGPKPHHQSNLNTSVSAIIQNFFFEKKNLHVLYVNDGSNLSLVVFFVFFYNARAVIPKERSKFNWLGVQEIMTAIRVSYLMPLSDTK